MYGVYGGLHIAPFGPLNERGEKIVKGMAKSQHIFKYILKHNTRR
jgi:hypothetical protein